MLFRSTFYFQLRADGQRITLKCEKQQVAVLSQYLQKLLDDLPAPSERPLPQSTELIPPVDEVEFIVGPMGLNFEKDLDRFVIMLEEAVMVDPDTGEPTGEDSADAGRIRFNITRGQALAFAERADAVVAAGRPSCTWCDLPVDPDGHACPRMN